MGQIKDWNVLLEKAAEAEGFEAVMSFVSDEEEPGGLYAESIKIAGGLKRDRKYIKGETALIDEADAREKTFLQKEEVNKSPRSKKRDGWESSIQRRMEQIEKAMSFLEDEAQRRYYPFGNEEKELKKSLLPMTEPFGEDAVKLMYAPKEKIEEAEESLWKKNDMKVSKDKAGRILNSVMKNDGSLRKHEIKVKMVHENAKRDETDMDDVIDEMTARLCAMMTKGADGIYL